jgi:N6-L-threonylcarbamoyladenine synthase
VFSLLEREEEAKKMLHDFFEQYEIPEIDLIAVTVGPGLEPALWVGISVARALALAWNKPIVGVNHMEGHIISPLLHGVALESEQAVTFPAVSLLVSGGHTELHAVESWTKYKMLGATRDDAAGEAFDKVARMLGLPYPGGPEISKLALLGREAQNASTITFPRPMIHSKDFDFSFSGLKTAVLYTVRDLPNGLNEELKQEIAKEFENAVVDVLTTKTLSAVEEIGAQTIIVGGGVAANKHLRSELTKRAKEKFGDIAVLFPEKELATDNAVMIAMAGYLDYIKNGSTGSDTDKLKAQGNLKI